MTRARDARWMRLLEPKDPYKMKGNPEAMYDEHTVTPNHSHCRCLQGSLASYPELHKFVQCEDVIEKFLIDEWKEENGTTRKSHSRHRRRH